jgi:uncharacterized membrane protein YkvA (DUF1232 family)
MENYKNDTGPSQDGQQFFNDLAYSAYYSESSLWNKILKYGRKAGISVIYAGLLLYYLLQKEGLPIRVKAAIIGALGYFILPIDVIPDVIAGLGYTDDLAILLMVLKYCSQYMDEGVKAKARAKTIELFDDCEVTISQIEKFLPSTA